MRPNVRGLVVGRALLYPPDGDVAAAIGRAADDRAAAQERADGPVTLHRPAGTPARRSRVALTPSDAGWHDCGLHVSALAPASMRALIDDGEERDGGPAAVDHRTSTVEVDGERFDLAGRTTSSTG